MQTRLEWLLLRVHIDAGQIRKRDLAGRREEGPHSCHIDIQAQVSPQAVRSDVDGDACGVRSQGPALSAHGVPRNQRIGGRLQAPGQPAFRVRLHVRNRPEAPRHVPQGQQLVREEQQIVRLDLEMRQDRLAAQAGEILRRADGGGRLHPGTDVQDPDSGRIHDVQIDCPPHAVLAGGGHQVDRLEEQLSRFPLHGQDQKAGARPNLHLAGELASGLDLER